MNYKLNYKPSKGTRACFVGSTRIPTPKRNGYSEEIFSVLQKQAGYTIKEWDGQEWLDLHTNDLTVLKSKKIR